MGAPESSHKASQSVGSALLGKTQRALLALFFVRPEESFYLRQIVRLAGVGQGAAQRELSAWVEQTEGAERFSRTLANSYRRARNAFRRGAGAAVPPSAQSIDHVRRPSTDRGASRRLFQDAGNPDQQICDHVAAIYFVQHFVPTA